MQLDNNYDTVTDTVGSAGPDVTVNTGDVVADGTTLYRYIGSAAASFDLTGDATATAAPDFTDATNWAQIGGTSGATYQYIGSGSATAPAQIDLNNTDYTDTSNWQLVQPALIGMSAPRR